MKRLTFNEFINYFNSNYIGTIGNMINYNSLINLILSSNDRWLYIFNTINYLFYILNLNIRYRDNEVYLENYKAFDELKLSKLNDNRDVVNEFAVKLYNIKRVSIGFNCKSKYYEDIIEVPVFNKKNEGIFIKKINKDILYIDINTFTNYNYQYLNHLININSILYIDLRHCYGGKINDMLNFLKIFSCNKNISLRFIDSKDNIYNKQIFNKNKSMLREVNFIVGENTASSGEIFCLLLRENFPGKIYGNETYGKMIIQEVIEVENSFVSLPLYKILKPELYYDNEIAKYNEDKIIPDIYGFEILQKL